MRAWRGPAAGLAAVLVALAPAAAGAQAWSAEVAAGRTAYELPDDVVGDPGASLALRRDWTAPAWLSLSGGLPLGDGGVSWGSVGGGARVGRDAGGWSLGVDLAGSAYAYGDTVGTGGGAVAEVLPRLGLRAGRLELELRAGVIGHAASGGSREETRGALASDARAALGAGAWEAAVEARHLRLDGEDFPFVGASVRGAHGPAAFWVRAGRWALDSLPDPEWGAGVDVRVGAGLTVFAALEERAADPLFRTPPRRAWSIGLRRRIGGRPAAPALAAPDPEGRITLRLPRSAAAEAPAVAGDFNGWEPLPMRPEGDVWAAALRIPSGVYRYAFRRADGTWFVPEDAPGRTDDGMGGVSALMIVP